MPLASGDHLGHYDILAFLGKGGMGEVYRGRDTKLKREVAIKVLPPVFRTDPERMARFQREAEVLASLNHPNIAAIYGVEDGALIMELVEGEAPKGPMPFDQAWPVAEQIAAALDYAHERGIIHRDLKPANVKVTPDGTVKLLDFGLAKAMSTRRESSVGTGEDSPTLTMGATEAGMILGTAAYMAPEQAKGKQVDKRADIWAFGVVLYELLTGDRVFKGEDIADTLAQVLTREPDLTAIPAKARKLIARCLEKNPKNRLRDIAEARYLIQEPVAAAVIAAAPPKRSWLWPAIAAAALLLAAGAGYSWWSATRPVEKPLIQLNAELGAEVYIGNNFGPTIAISPDARRIAFVQLTKDGKHRLATRLLEASDVTVLEQAGEVASPTFSPDSRWIAFFAEGKLKKISVDGGSPVTLCDAPNPRGISWGEDDNILFAANNRAALSRVSAAGGVAQEVTKLERNGVTHRYGQLLPGGQAFLFTSSMDNNSYEQATIEVQTLSGGQRKTVVKGASYGRYLPSGHLLYWHDGVFFAAPFDLKSLSLSGPAVPVLDRVNNYSVRGYGDIDVSPSGTAVYVPGKQNSLGYSFWSADPTGKLEPLGAPSNIYNSPQASPDGTRIAVVATMNGPGNLAVFDPASKRVTQLTNLRTVVQNPTWSRDGKHLAFRTVATELQGPGVYWIRADGAAPPVRILEGSSNIPMSLSPDGKRLLYLDLTGLGDIWTLPLEATDTDNPKPGRPELFFRTERPIRNAKFSPDGKWIAHSGGQTGTEAFVRPFPGPGGVWQISSGGAGEVYWPRNGQVLFSGPNNGIMQVDYTVANGSFTPGQAREWLRFPPSLQVNNGQDVTPDGKRVIVLGSVDTQSSTTGPTHATFLFNFFDELRRRAPVK